MSNLMPHDAFMLANKDGARTAEEAETLIGYASFAAEQAKSSGHTMRRKHVAEIRIVLRPLDRDARPEVGRLLDLCDQWDPAGAQHSADARADAAAPAVEPSCFAAPTIAAAPSPPLHVESADIASARALLDDTRAAFNAQDTVAAQLVEQLARDEASLAEAERAALPLPDAAKEWRDHAAAGVRVARSRARATAAQGELERLRVALDESARALLVAQYATLGERMDLAAVDASVDAAVAIEVERMLRERDAGPRQQSIVSGVCFSYGRHLAELHRVGASLELSRDDIDAEIRRRTRLDVAVTGGGQRILDPRAVFGRVRELAAARVAAIDASASSPTEQAAE